jgi:hypothetical protein
MRVLALTPGPSPAPLDPPQACPRVIPAYAGRGGGCGRGVTQANI